MCEELNLLQYELGIWSLKNWTIKQSIIQLSGLIGIYCIKNTKNNMVLIGEGNIPIRLGNHINPKNNKNSLWKKLITTDGIQSLVVDWIIPEDNEIKRKIIENKLQIYFGENCYNKFKRQYLTYLDIINDKNPETYGGNLVNKINNYKLSSTGCWISNHPDDGYGYHKIYSHCASYRHHILMYIFHYGDINSIIDVIHHKCNNKHCVNPEHLELTTNIGNSHKYHNITSTPIINKNICYRGVFLNTRKNRYTSTIKISGKIFNFGYYDNIIKAAQNRDYYIVKNNLWSKPRSTLNFHNIDYYNFTPWKTVGNSVNRYLI